MTVIASKPPTAEQGGESQQESSDSPPSGDWGQSFLAQIRPRLVPNYHYLFQVKGFCSCVW